MAIYSGSKKITGIYNGSKRVTAVYNGMKLIWPQFDADNVRKIASDGYFTLILMKDQTVWSAGDNSYGQLCRNVATGTSAAANFEPVPGVTDATDIAVSIHHSLILRGNQLWSAGDNSAGQLCRNVATGTWAATNFGPIDGTAGVTEIAAGSGKTFLRIGNQLWNAGSNGTGQLCRNVASGTATATNFGPVPGVTDATGIALGAQQSLILRGNQLWSAGHNNYGELCRVVATGTESATNFGQVPGVTDATRIASGFYHSLVLRGNQLWSAGGNFEGQLCRNVETGTEATPNFGPIDGMSNVTAFTAGGAHNLILHDNRLWSGGNNASGQLCRNVTNGTPTGGNFGPIDGVENASILGAGQLHSLFVWNDRLWSAGRNEEGQLCRNVATGSATATNFGYVT